MRLLLGQIDCLFTPFMTLDNSNCGSCSITKINIIIHESVGAPAIREVNLSWMPHKDYKIMPVNKKYVEILGSVTGRHDLE